MLSPVKTEAGQKVWATPHAFSRQTLIYSNSVGFVIFHDIFGHFCKSAQSVLFNFNTCFKILKYCPRLEKLDAEPKIMFNRTKNYNREHCITETFSSKSKIQKTASLAVCKLSLERQMKTKYKCLIQVC